MSHPVIDPILVAVIGNRFDAITKEIGQTMLRTSRSPIFSEARDFVTGIFDKHCRLVAQTAYIPVLMGCLPYAVKSISDHFKDDVYEGDVFILNDPFSGNNHPPDITVAKPVFWQGELQFWSISKGHHADVGGGGVAGYNPESTSVFDECIRIPPSRLYHKGVYQRDMWNVILKNVRLDFIVEGDLHCQVGACNIGARGLLTILDKYGVNTLYTAIDEIFDASEKHMRKEIAKIPSGKYYAERLIDSDGVNKTMIKVGVEITVANDSLTFDFSSSEKDVIGYVNSTMANTASSCYVAILTSIDSDFAFNEGALRPMKVIAPEGSVVNCTFPAPTSCSTISTSTPIIEAIWLALAEAIPGQVQSCWARWCAPATLGFNPKTGRTFADIHFMNKGGGGATFGFDGWDHMGVVVTSGGLRAPDPELHEMSSPYFLMDYEYLPDSAGAGKWRGGMGTIYRWRVDAPGIKAAHYGGGTSDVTAPYGLQGGKNAPKNIAYITRAGGEVINLEVERLYDLEVGDIFEIYESGGGGFGDPLERPIEKVAKDVRDGLVSVRAAKEDYGVIVDPITFQVDMAATTQQRARR